MKVKMKKTAASPGSLYEAGKVYEIPDDEAKRFIDAEACDPVDASVPVAPKVEKLKEPVKKDK